LANGGTGFKVWGKREGKSAVQRLKQIVNIEVTLPQMCRTVHEGCWPAE